MASLRSPDRLCFGVQFDDRLRETPGWTAARGGSGAGALPHQHCHHPGHVASSQGLTVGRATRLVVGPWGIGDCSLVVLL